MKKNTSTSGRFNPRIFLSFVLCSAGFFLALAGVTPPNQDTPLASANPAPPPQRYMPVAGEKGEELDRLEQEWNNRLTYPTGIFNPEWLRVAAVKDSLIARAIPAGLPLSKSASALSPLALSTTGFTALGPAPLRMTGCSGCYNYSKTEGRVNTIAVDPTTTTDGSIVAYLGSVGGGVWKTTNCCSSSTTWSVTTDDPLLSTITIDTLAIDPNNHNTIYAGTGDLNYGSFSMGSQGILKSTNAGASWTVLGASVFGPALTEPAGQFPQYDAVGKVRVDPNNSNNVVAGTKTGLYFSYDGGNNWTGPCTTNNFTTQRQDITGLELSNVGGTTRIIAAVGVRGFPTTVQYNLGQNGANGIYSATMTNSGCPSFSSIARNDNGFVFGTQVTGSPYLTGALMNAGSGVPCNYPITVGNGTYCGNGAAGGSTTNGGTVNNVGRIDIAVAPSNPNYIYAQVGSINWNNNTGCANTAGCQLGAWASTDGGSSWSFINGSAGGSLRNCSNGQGDYAQNWYDQGLAVDPNDPNRVFFDTFEIWFWKSGNTSWSDTTCGYSGNTEVVHVDQHALAFVPGSSSILLAGSDGGVYATSNANIANGPTHNQWVNMDTGLNTIEFYSGDISGNFATSASPQANGGAQDNGSMSVTFSGSPTGPVQWQMGKGGDGFYGRIDPVGGHFYQGNNSGHVSVCVSNCTASGATWTDTGSPWSNPGSPDIQSFVLPYEIYKGIPGDPVNDCPPSGCGHLVVGTQRVWETFDGVTWNPVSLSLVKGTLGNRSFINQLAFAPATQAVVMIGTNDGNVQFGFAAAPGSPTAAWVDVTGGNTVLPNRPILDVAVDPTTTTAPIGYAAVGGFAANTPTTSGHVYRVVCTGLNCASFTWTDKSGNLPDIPVDSIIANPKFPQQVFAGTDWGLYFTNDITAASPLWYRFDTGLPHAMIWDMQIDRGNTTLSVWTRSRGAYAWPLPDAPLPTLTSVVSRMNHAGTDYDVDLTPPSSNTECRSGGAGGNYTMVFTFSVPITSCGVATTNHGSVSASPSGSQCTVQMSNVPNGQYTTVQLTGVLVSGGGALNATGTMGVLIGDSTNDKSVNSADISQTKSRSGQTVGSTNFRSDVTVDGNLNSADISLVKSKSGTALP